MNKILSIFFLLFTAYGSAQTSTHNGVALKGTIKDYGHQPVYLFECYADTLLLVDSALAAANGDFQFRQSAFSGLSKKEGTGVASKQLYKVVLQHNQFFYIIYNASQHIVLTLQTVYQANPFSNIASDSLKFIGDDRALADNRQLYQFQQIQQQLNVSNYWLLQMMRLYPFTDPFHKHLEEEYYNRYETMQLFVKKQMELAPANGTTKLSMAYYQPVLPDWKEPDPDRNRIIARHYFDYFNPADEFYLHTNILAEKTEEWLTLNTDNTESQPANETRFEQAADSFLVKLGSNSETFEFTLGHILKKARKLHYDVAFLHLYDTYLKIEAGNCGPDNITFNWVRELANTLRNVQLGSLAPDFDLQKGSLKLHQLQADYTLLVFWASWCPHCTNEIPQLKKVVEGLNKKLNSGKEGASLTGGNAGGKIMITVAVSLDTDEKAWQKYVNENGLFAWINTSELKGWNAEVARKYNVYATPTMFLLDADKKIIARPENAQQLINYFNSK